jgi:Flp pilus assembly protein TadD
MSNNEMNDDFVDENLVNDELGEEALSASSRGPADEGRLAPPARRPSLLRFVVILFVLIAAGGGAFYFYTQLMPEDIAVKPATMAAKPAQTAADRTPSTPAAPGKVIDLSDPQPIMAQVDIPQADLPPQPEPDDSAVASTAPVPVAQTSVPGVYPFEEPMPSSELPPEENIGAIGIIPPGPSQDNAYAAPGFPPSTQNKPFAPPAEVAPGELAIVQNDVILNNVGGADGAVAAQPGVNPLGAAADLPLGAGPALAKPAIVRPVPEDYLTVRKERDADDVDSRLMAARAALSRARYAAALQLFNELHADFPKDKRILTGRAVTMQKLGQIEAALIAYEEALTEDPRNIDALNNMLGILKKQDPGLALQKLSELRDAYPYNGDITAQLAVAYGANADFSSALKYLDIADSLMPGNVMVLYNRGVLFDKMGRTAEAGVIYRQIVRMAADGTTDMQGLPLDMIRQRLATIR